MINKYSTQDLIQYNRSISKKLTEICQPLKDFGFSSFGYTRIYYNGKRFVLETNRKWLEKYSQIDFLEQNEGTDSLIYNVIKVISHKCNCEFYSHILTGKPKSKLHECLFSLDLWNSLSIYVHLNKFVEVFHLNPTKDNENVIDFYFNKKDLLQRFVHFFRDKIFELNIEKAPYTFDNELLKIFSKDLIVKEDLTETNKIQDYIKQTNINKFYLKTHDKFITVKEAACLHYLALGKTYKEIARLLKISTPTVVSHINTLKNKTTSNSTADLVNLSHQNYISSFDFFR